MTPRQDWPPPELRGANIITRPSDLRHIGQPADAARALCGPPGYAPPPAPRTNAAQDAAERMARAMQHMSSVEAVLEVALIGLGMIMDSYRSGLCTATQMHAARGTLEAALNTARLRLSERGR